MGEKYNTLAQSAPADLYLAWADDVEMLTNGWDERLREAAETFRTDDDLDSYHAGFIYSGQSAGGNLPGLYALNSRAYSLLGYFAPEWFPNWWCETWINEIALLAGRVLNLDPLFGEIKYRELLKDGDRGKTQGLKDLAFWADFFERTRRLRVADADRLLEADEERPWRVAQLLAERPQMIEYFESLGLNLRVNANAFETQYCADAGSSDPRYERAKAKALAWIKENSK